MYDIKILLFVGKLTNFQWEFCDFFSGEIWGNGWRKMLFVKFFNILEMMYIFLTKFVCVTFEKGLKWAKN